MDCGLSRYHVDCNSSIRYPFNDFLILVQYFIAYAQL